jgi:hypothetical protein
VACIMRRGTLVGAPFEIDFEHGHTALSSTRFHNVLGAQVRQWLAVLIQLDKRGLRAAGDAECPALIARWNLKDIVEENGHLDEVRPPLHPVRSDLHWFLHSRPSKKRNSYS